VPDSVFGDSENPPRPITREPLWTRFDDSRRKEIVPLVSFVFVFHERSEDHARMEIDTIPFRIQTEIVMRQTQQLTE
jgi:hypothetical protein